MPAAINTEKRNEILQASYQLFGSDAYNKVSFSRIAEASGISKSLLQRYYPQKIEIMRALLEDLLNISFEYLKNVNLEYTDIFQQISDFNMLFFKTASQRDSLDSFVLASVSQPELLDLWIDSITGWLSHLCDEDSFSYEQLHRAICFSMGGSMHLYQHKDELNIDYRYICPLHIRSILTFLDIDPDRIHTITENTETHLQQLDISSFAEYIHNNINWLTSL